MLRHYFTLKKVVDELQALAGCEVMECFTQERDSVEIVFNKGGEQKYLHFSANPALCSIFLRNNFARARKNSTDLFEDLIGECLQKVFLKDFDRIVCFEFINTKMFALLYGGAASNLLITRNDGLIINALNSKKINIGKIFTLEETKPRSFFEFTNDDNIRMALAKCDLLLGSYYADEVCDRLNINPDFKIKDFSETDLKTIYEKAEQFRSECLSSNSFFLFSDNNDNTILSLIKLNRFPVITLQFDSISSAIQKRLTTESRTLRLEPFRKQLLNIILKQQRRLEKLLENLRNFAEADARSVQYRLYADLLMCEPNPRIKPGKLIKVNSFDNESIDIQLNEKYNLLENAEIYFKKSKAAREDSEIRKKRIPKTEITLIECNECAGKIQNAEYIKELEQIKKDYPQFFKFKMKQEFAEQKFRKFELAEGYTLYVGKSAATNDELTLKFAKPNDLWLHARGSAGSHAVLTLIKDQKPPKDILKKAAEITAYYSQSRNAKYTHVCYTLKKNVRKPKGANTGSVVISREEVIMVEPKLPEDMNEF